MSVFLFLIAVFSEGIFLKQINTRLILINNSKVQ